MTNIREIFRRRPDGSSSDATRVRTSSGVSSGTGRRQESSINHRTGSAEGCQRSFAIAPLQSPGSSHSGGTSETDSAPRLPLQVSIDQVDSDLLESASPRALQELFASKIGTADDQAAASRAVALVINSARKGMVSLCIDVADVFRANQRLEARVATLTAENAALHAEIQRRDLVANAPILTLPTQIQAMPPTPPPSTSSVSSSPSHSYPRPVPLTPPSLHEFPPPPLGDDDCGDSFPDCRIQISAEVHRTPALAQTPLKKDVQSSRPNIETLSSTQTTVLCDNKSNDCDIIQNVHFKAAKSDASLSCMSKLAAAMDEIDRLHRHIHELQIAHLDHVNPGLISRNRSSCDLKGDETVASSPSDSVIYELVGDDENLSCPPEASTLGVPKMANARRHSLSLVPPSQTRILHFGQLSSLRCFPSDFELSTKTTGDLLPESSHDVAALYPATPLLSASGSLPTSASHQLTSGPDQSRSKSVECSPTISTRQNMIRRCEDLPSTNYYDSSKTINHINTDADSQDNSSFRLGPQTQDAVIPLTSSVDSRISESASVSNEVDSATAYIQSAVAQVHAVAEAAALAHVACPRLGVHRDVDTHPKSSDSACKFRSSLSTFVVASKVPQSVAVVAPMNSRPISESLSTQSSPSAALDPKLPSPSRYLRGAVFRNPLPSLPQHPALSPLKPAISPKPKQHATSENKIAKVLSAGLEETPC